MSWSAVLTNGEGACGIARSVELLHAGRSALDAIEEGIHVVELNPSVRTVGIGGAPNALGVMECDASIMCGSSMRTGAVGALRDFLHPISVARKVMERTPHVMLVGEGAYRFATEMAELKGELLSAEAATAYEAWKAKQFSAPERAAWPNVALAEALWSTAKPDIARGTTCYLACGADAMWGAGVSTSGWAYKHPGRLGDSPIIGAGMYVDSRFGAVGCTHTGEMTIRAGTARAVMAYLSRGASAEEAAHEAGHDLRRLQGGHLGPVVIHILPKNGAPFAGSIGLPAPIDYWYWDSDLTEAQRRKTVLL